MKRFELIGFDADDTLWETERLYVEAQARLRSLLSRYTAAERIDGSLYQTEMRNLEHFGYGIKAFALSMIETSIELTDGRVTASDIKEIIAWARQMMSAEVELIAGVPETLAALAAGHSLMLITKGDLRDQETKIARSQLQKHFRFVEIVSDKSRETYRTILDRHAISPARFLMIGNSLRSDILPVLELGGSAVFIPHELTWAHETAEAPRAGSAGFYQVERIGQLPGLVAQLEGREEPRF